MRFPNPKPRVESFRIPIDCAVDVRLRPSDAWKRISANNISMSGMFLRTTERHKKGTVLAVKFELHNGQPAIRAQVEVLWRRIRDAGPDKPPGLGVRFLDLDLESKYAISHLVDRYQQLGRTPFSLTAVEDELSTLTRSAWGLQGAVALAFLAGLLTGAAGSWWFTRSGPETAGAVTATVVTAGVVEAKELTPKTSTHGTAAVEPTHEAGAQDTAATVDLPQTSPEEPAPTTGSQTAQDPAVAVKAAVEAWAQAWADKDVERYLSAYAANFEPDSGLSQEAWQSQRRERLNRPGPIEVRLSGVEVEILTPDRAIARFDQAYTTPGYRDRVQKTLMLIWQDPKWRIEREQIQAELPND